MTLAARSSTTAQASTTVVPQRPWTLSALMVGAAVVALGIAVRAPMTTTVLGLIAFGVLHNVLEIRYVAGRFAGVLTGLFLRLLLLLVTGIVVCRVLQGYIGAPAQYAEIAIGYLVLGVGTWRGLTQWRRWAGLVALAPAAALSLANPAYHFVVLAHLHNLVPLVFLWEWASRLDSRRGRRLFRATQVAWVLVIPILLAVGLADRWLVGGTGVVEQFVGSGERVLAASAPPGQAATVVGLRFLAVFAFLQTMHYVVWVAFLPTFAPDASQAFEARVPWLTPRRLWTVGGVAALFLGVLFLTDWAQGKAVYAALASYHAYLEFPVLLALLLGGQQVIGSATAAAVPGVTVSPSVNAGPGAG
ncbi:MAG: hypothetical protein ABI083_06905 [Lapillicoccus sp.]